MSSTKWNWLVVVYLFFCFGRGFSDPSLSLEEIFEQELNSSSIESIPTTVQDYHYVFVGGFVSEFLPLVFKDNISTLQNEFGIKTMTVIKPDTLRSIEENLDDLYLQLEAIYTKSAKPLILIAHSKGGVEALLTLLKFPDLVDEDKVAKLVAVQGAFGGSVLADLADAAISFADLNWDWPALQSLRPAQIQPLVSKSIENFKRNHHRELQDKIHNRVFYVRGEVTESEFASKLFKPSYQVLSWMGDNDGVLFVDDQIVDGLGVDLGVLDADHAAFFSGGVISNQPAKFRKAFTRALVRKII